MEGQGRGGDTQKCHLSLTGHGEGKPVRDQGGNSYVETVWEVLEAREDLSHMLPAGHTQMRPESWPQI